jgi:hypothetical protein
VNLTDVVGEQTLLLALLERRIHRQIWYLTIKGMGSNWSTAKLVIRSTECWPWFTTVWRNR